jgi:ABC-type Fe3+/spermidine/putrescine transport system ATPase subunit
MDGLRVSNLVKSFGAANAIDDVSFTVDAGEFVSLLGPSGCGKTTTLRCIAGFERPDSGVIAVGNDILTNPQKGIFVPPNRRHFGMVFQSYAVWPHMTVMENVGYPLKIAGKLSKAQIEERVHDKLRIVGLTGYEARYPTQLSGGQQQRVALARALVMEPRVLLFDEPLSNLDAKLRERMRFELIEIQSGLGVPALYVTHDQSEAMVMSKKVIVMEAGGIAQAGAPEDIYRAPSSRFVADFIGSSNFVDAEIMAESGKGRFETMTPWGKMICTGKGSYAKGATVVVAIRPERVEYGAKAKDENAFKATVKSRFFLGPFLEYFITAGDETLRMQRTASIPEGPGDTVTLRVDPEFCQIVGLAETSKN